MYQHSSMPRRKDSGPLVVHVDTPERTARTEERNQVTMNDNTTRSSRRSERFFLMIGCLFMYMSIRIINENRQMEKSSGANIRSKSKTTSKMFDVNAPPPDATTRKKKNKIKSFWESGVGHGEKNENAKGNKKKNTKKNGKQKTRQNGVQLVEMNDDEIPQAKGGTAADALLCPDSVLDYVINATDLKDECTGMEKAYAKYCTGNGHPTITQNRRLTTTDTTIEESILLNFEPRKTNPILAWKNVISSWLGSDRSRQPVEMSPRFDDDDDDYALNQYIRKLKGQETEDSNKVSIEERRKPNLAAKEKEKVQLSSLKLPLKGHHHSQKTLSDSLMLTQDEKVIASAIAVQQNSTNTTVAVAQAAASSKAVADTSDLVSSILNDPASVEARTCCTSMIGVFNDICRIDEEEELSDQQLFLVVAVVAICGLVKSLIRHFQVRWLPEAGGCILVGVAAGYILKFYPHHEFSFDGNWFLRIMVPPIIFEAALSIDKRSFNRHVVPILLYATIGTLMATFVTAFFVSSFSYFYKCTTIPFTEALTFGALISSIDPIAVLSVLSNMGMTDTDTIYVLIFGESLLNDGVAIVLFQTLLHFLDDNMEGDPHAIFAAVIHFMVVAIGSLLIGLGAGICCTVYYWMMHGCQTPLVEILMFFCWALLPYYVCDGIEWSGIVAVVAAGFVMDLFVVGQDQQIQEDKSESLETPRRRRVRPMFSREGHLSTDSKLHINFVTEIIATMMETAIFAYLGLFLFSARYHWNVSLAIISIVACLVSRAVMIPMLSLGANMITTNQQRGNELCSQSLSVIDLDEPKQPNAAGVIIDRKMQLVLWFAGLRGAMSFALVENIPLYDPVTGEGTGLKAELKAMTSACVIFTVFVLGGCTYYMMEFLGMAPSMPSPSSTRPNELAPNSAETEMVRLLEKETDDDRDNLIPLEYNVKTTPSPKRGNRFRQRIRE